MPYAEGVTVEEATTMNTKNTKNCKKGGNCSRDAPLDRQGVLTPRKMGGTSKHCAGAMVLRVLRVLSGRFLVNDALRLIGRVPALTSELSLR